MSQEKQNQRYSNGHNQPIEPDPEVRVAGKRRQYTQPYKLQVLAEAEQCKQGEMGALLRWEGLYYSTLSKWPRTSEAVTKCHIQAKNWCFVG